MIIDSTLNLHEVDERIEAVRENLRELIEQASADSGGSIEELIARRITEQEEQLDYLMRLRGQLCSALQ